MIFSKILFLKLFQKQELLNFRIEFKLEEYKVALDILK